MKMFGLKKYSFGGAIALAFCGLASQAFAHPDSLVLTPPLGWNSWNVFHENINEKQIQEIAEPRRQLDGHQARCARQPPE